MLCSYLPVPYVTALASKCHNMGTLCTGCPAHSGLSHGAAELWGITALSTSAKSFSDPWWTRPPHCTQESNLFQRNCWKFFLPFPCLHVPIFLTQQDVSARAEMTRASSGMRNIEMGTAMTTGSLQCHHHHPKKTSCASQSKKEHLASDYS